MRRVAEPSGEASDQCGLDQLVKEIKMVRSGCTHGLD